MGTKLHRGVDDNEIDQNKGTKAMVSAKDSEYDNPYISSHAISKHLRVKISVIRVIEGVRLHSGMMDMPLRLIYICLPDIEDVCNSPDATSQEDNTILDPQEA